MVHAVGQYGLRARRSGHRSADAGISAEEMGEPAAAAALTAGLRPRALSKAELLNFAKRTQPYLEARNAILLKWAANPTTYLTAEACIESTPSEEAMTRDAHAFLHKIGCINTGIVRGEPAKAAAKLSDEELAWRTHQILKTADMQVTSEKMIRKQLTGQTGEDMAPRKGFIRDQVQRFLAKAPAPPKPERKAPGRAVVIGAGPAGLVAALHLQRNGVEATVLEARDRVGGRVHTLRDGRFACPIDLGASLITGTQTDVVKGARADPSALVASQLGLPMHELVDNLPLWDGATGRKVAPETDKLAGAMLDALMDEAAQLAEDMPSDAAGGESFGGMLERAFGARFGAADNAPGHPLAAGNRSEATVPSAAAADAAPAEASAQPADHGPAEPQPQQQPVHPDVPQPADETLAPAVKPEGGKSKDPDAPLPTGGRVPRGGPMAPAADIGADATASAFANPAAHLAAEAALVAGGRQEAEAGQHADAAAAAEGGGDGAAAQPVAPIQLSSFAGSSDGAVLVQPDGPDGRPDPTQPAMAPNNVLADAHAAKHAAQQATLTPSDNAPGAAASEAADADATPITDLSGVPASPLPDGSAAAGGPAADTAVQASAPAEPSDPVAALDALVDQFGGADDEEQKVDLPDHLSEELRRLLDWHWSALEYGCSAPLSKISALHWNQDEEFGGFGGPHCTLPGGYGAVTDALGGLLPGLRLSTPVSKVEDTTDGVRVTTASGEVIEGDSVIVSVPLGCLKAGAIAFSPPLPDWKRAAISALGNGNLNKVVLQFPAVFWDDSVDFFGAAPEGGPALRGRCSTFWNLHRWMGQPILMGLLTGLSADQAEKDGDAATVAAAMAVLRRLFGDAIPEPTATHMSRWGSDPYSRGSYSYVAVGASGKTYEALARPVRRRLLFAGEHTSMEHPDTVGGAMISGLREACRLLAQLREEDEAAAVAFAGALPTKVRRARDEEIEALFDADAPDGDAKLKKARKRRPDDAAPRKRPKKEAVDSEDLERRVAGSLGRDVERIMLDQAAREAARADQKAVWRALALAATGDLSGILAMLGSEASPATRLSLLEALPAAAGPAKRHVARSRPAMATLNAWAGMWAAGDATDLASLHALALLELPIEAEVLKAAGLPKTLRTDMAKCSSHECRVAAGQLLKRWADAFGPPPKPRTPPASGAPPAAIGSRSNGSTGVLTGSTGVSAVPERLRSEAGPPADGIGVDTDMELAPEDVPAELLEAERAAQEADAAAAEFAAQSAQLMAHMGGSSARLPRIDEFRAKKRRGLLASADRVSAKASSRSSKHSSGKSRHGSGSGASGGSDQKGQPLDNDNMKALGEYIGDLLKPLYAAKRISKDQFKAVARRAADKVAKTATCAPGEAFLTDPRKEKVRNLVDAYVKMGQAGKLK